jgi:hypothetical protein
LLFIAVQVRALDAHVNQGNASVAFLSTKGVLPIVTATGPTYPRVGVLEGRAGQPALLGDALITSMLQHDIVITTAAYMAYSRDRRRPRLDAIQYYNRLGTERPLLDLIVFDEAHHTPAGTWRDILDKCGSSGHTKVLHTTATPFRADCQRIERDADVPAFSLINGLHMVEEDAGGQAAFAPCVKDLCFLEIERAVSSQLDALRLLTLRKKSNKCAHRPSPSLTLR